jgi:hypothetical protein
VVGEGESLTPSPSERPDLGGVLQRTFIEWRREAPGARLTVKVKHAQRELRSMMGWYHDGMGGGGRPAHHDPLDTLDERVARGEIDETEYRACADVLRAVHH